MSDWRARLLRRSGSRIVRFATPIVAVIIGLLAWTWWASRFDVTVFPSPAEASIAAVDLVESGELLGHIGISLYRILVGFLIASAAGIPVGMLMGTSWFAESAFAPLVGFFRFLPSIALVAFALLWFGVGESAKIFLVFFTTVFIVIINTEAGVHAMPRDRVRGAQSFGASQIQMFFFVVLPSVVPYMLTGMRIGMGRSFTTIVAAEILAAESGLGYLIFSSRVFARTDIVFVGIACLGLLGFVIDRVFRVITARLARAYV